MTKPNLRTVEIFKAGTHTSMEGTALSFSEADLAKIASSYSPTVHEAPLVVGHPEIDKPAYGWVQSVSSPKAGVLVAAVDQVDASFAELVNEGRFKKVSASFYMPDAPNNPAPGGYYLRHVGFLGATPPVVKGLKQASFSEKEEGTFTVEFSEAARFGEWEQKSIARMFKGMRDFIIEKFGLETADKVLPTWDIDHIQDSATRDGMKDSAGLRIGTSFSEPTKTKTQEPDVKTAEQIAADAAAALKTREEAVAAREASFAEKEAKERRAVNVAFIDGLVAAAKFPAAHKDAALSFMEKLDATQVVSFGEGDKAPKATALDQFKAFLNAYPPAVSFGEAAPADKTTVQAGDLPATKQLADEITAYRTEQAAKGITVSYAEATTHVSKKYATK